MESNTNFENLSFNPTNFLNHQNINTDCDPDENVFNSINVDTKYYDPDTFYKSIKTYLISH